MRILLLALLFVSGCACVPDTWDQNKIVVRKNGHVEAIIYFYEKDAIKWYQDGDSLRLDFPAGNGRSIRRESF